MADAAVAAGLNAVPLVTQHHHHVTKPVRQQYRKMMGKERGPDPDTRDHRTYEEKGYVLRKRSEVASDEEIVDTVRHRGEVLPRRPRRPGMDRRRSSMNDARNRNQSRGGYESEGSVPPRSRTRAKSEASRRKRGSSSSSASSSDLLSSTEEEKECRKIGRKKWITAGLASVATIHAASKVYSSIESHDKRILAVQAGELSPEEAHKKQRQTRWQDAAAIAIAALGIKGAISEWNEVTEEHQHHKEVMEKRAEHHQRRLERMRREKAREQGGYYKARDGNWCYDGPEPQGSERSQSRQVDGPRNGERKMIEGGSRQRGRSAYDDDRYGSTRSRSRYGREDDDYARDRRRPSSRYTRDDDY